MHVHLKPDFGPETAAFQCYLCKWKKRDGDVVVGTGISIETEGMLDICSTCVRELAHAIGMKPDEKVAEMEAQVEKLTRDLDAAYRRNAHLEAQVAEVDIRRRELDRSLAQIRAVKKMTPEQAQRVLDQHAAEEKKAKQKEQVA